MLLKENSVNHQSYYNFSLSVNSEFHGKLSNHYRDNSLQITNIKLIMKRLRLRFLFCDLCETVTCRKHQRKSWGFTKVRRIHPLGNMHLMVNHSYCDILVWIKVVGQTTDWQCHPYSHASNIANKNRLTLRMNQPWAAKQMRTWYTWTFCFLKGHARMQLSRASTSHITHWMSNLLLLMQ